MNHQHPLDRTHATGVPPVVDPGLPAGPTTPNFIETNPIRRFAASHPPRTPKNAKRTLNKTHATGVPPLYLTLTEVGDTPTPKKAKRTQFPNTQTEANSLCTNDLTKIGDSYLFLTIPTRPTPGKCKTNPISAPPDKMLPTNDYMLNAALNETNPISPTADLCKTKKCETNPISPTADLCKTKKSKRTQSTPGELCKTNPIPAPPDKILRTIDYMLQTTLSLCTVRSYEKRKGGPKISPVTATTYSNPIFQPVQPSPCRLL